VKRQNDSIRNLRSIAEPNEWCAENRVGNFVIQSETSRTSRRVWLRRGGVRITAALLGIASCVLVNAKAQSSKTESHEHHSTFPIPEAIRAEHAEIHDQLVAATKVQGPVGEAARRLAAVLDPHFLREEQIALPPLGLLAPLSRGEFTPEMREVIKMTDALRSELPRMLEEHKAIHAANAAMGAAAKAEGNAAVERLAETLKLHAQSEEQILYPAAILVGDLVRCHSTGKPPRP
jgi:hemerythrin HHE cation binding domain-containing protein